MVLGKLKSVVSNAVKTVDIESKSSSNEELGRKVAELEEYNQQYPEPTEEEYATLPRVAGYAPYQAYLICLVEFAERASYYGVQGCLANFVQLPLPEGGNGAGAPARGTQKNAGALGLGLQVSTAISLLLTFMVYLTPLVGGYLADKRWGRVRTIWWGIWIGGFSHIIMIIAAIPTVLKHGHSALAPTIISIITLAFGSGFIKPNLLPLLYDQYQHKRDVVITDEKTGKKVIVSRDSTLQKMTLFFYWAVNVGGFFAVATSYSAKRVGFWLAFLLPGIVYFVTVPVLMMVSPSLSKEAPSGYSVLGEALGVLGAAFKPGFIGRMRRGEFWEYAMPSVIAEKRPQDLEKVNKRGEKKISWTDQFVKDVRVTFASSYLFLYYVIYNINDSGLGSVTTSQANGMTTNGVPNDLINNINPLVIIVFIPILDYVIYPIMNRYGINFRPVYKVFTGFMLASLASVSGAIIQHYIYKTSPCGNYASNCDIGTGVSPISVWVECVLYALQAMSECFAMTAGYELAYTRAPVHMRGLVMALFLFTTSLSAALSEALTGALVDPHITWVFAGTAIAGAVFAFAFLFVYRNLHIEMDKERHEQEEKLRLEFISKMEELEKDKVQEDVISAQVSRALDTFEEDKELQAIASASMTKK
ncbi:hypothetical protein WICPIJ_006590 [Wickerhamomyces pijperi]|uniref:Peptide transporter PTR2 n=1 Tax=Wickerhamomyces pijperi TaxID=599730 RepID=A0A9P8Q1U3_WICPI|nr:hypothetical protein WICPIJ_006590 [Wickerhamomyces pijperi]